jgi:isopenicillin N synthase-like dioxygenase
MLQKLSGDRIKATYHRVYDIGIERFSCPFFYGPKYTATGVVDDMLASGRKLCEDKNYDKKMKK